MCPGAAEDRQHWQSSLERDAESAAHADNLIPIERASRGGLMLRGSAIPGWPRQACRRGSGSGSGGVSEDPPGLELGVRALGR